MNILWSYLWSTPAAQPAITVDDVHDVKGNFMKKGKKDNNWETFTGALLSIQNTAWEYSKKLVINFGSSKYSSLLAATMDYKLINPSDVGAGFSWQSETDEFQFLYSTKGKEAEVVDLAICRAIYMNWNRSAVVESNEEALDFVRTLKVAFTEEEPEDQPYEQQPPYLSQPAQPNSVLQSDNQPTGNADDGLDSYLDSDVLSQFGQMTIKGTPSKGTESSIPTHQTPPVSPEALKSNPASPGLNPSRPLSTKEGHISELKGEHILVNVSGSLYRHEEAVNPPSFVLFRNTVDLVVTDIYPDSKKRFKKVFHIIDGEKILLSVVITSEIYPAFQEDPQFQSFTWNAQNSFLRLLYSKEDELLKPIFLRALWEEKNQLPYPEENNNQKSLESFFEGNPVRDRENNTPSKQPRDHSDSESESESENESESESESESKSESANESENESENEDEHKGPSKAKNSILNVGKKKDLSYVVKGNQIEVFKKLNKGIKHVTKLKNIYTSKREQVNPKVSMLHQEDSALLLVDQQDKERIYRMDVEKGSIVAEYDTVGMSVDSLLPETKTAQETSTSSFMALNQNGIFAVDPRERHPVVKNRGFQYSKTNPKYLSCGATTGKGNIVVGTKKGEIRFYGSSLFKQTNSVDPKATNAFPSIYGDPILSVDVTASGRWVLATCAKYLLVYPTKIGDFTAFDITLSKTEKPTPIFLKLKKIDEQKVGEVNFTPAKFNKGPTETRICTSTGKWLISWNFRAVRKNNTNDYTMKEFSDVVVDDDFMGDSIVVTLPHQVQLARLK